MQSHAVTYPHTDQGDHTPVRLVGGGYAVRCARAIVHDNVPDALWALEVLNKYGHLVLHPADRLGTREAFCYGCGVSLGWVPLAAHTNGDTCGLPECDRAADKRERDFTAFARND